MKHWKTLAMAAGTLCLASPPVKAEFPDRPITMIVAFSAGSPPDTLMRAFAYFLEQALGDGARVEVVNKAGAAGEVGFAAGADAAPDGYTLIGTLSPNINAIPIERKARYSLDRIDPLYNLVDDPSALASAKDGPFKTLADVVAFAKANPDAVTVGTSGIGSDDHIALLLFQRQAGVTFTHIPFQGAAANQAALAGKKIMLSSINIGEAQHTQKQKEKEPTVFLGVLANARPPSAADIATFKEQGYPVLMSTLRGIAAPKGLPPEIRAKLVDAIGRAASDPAFQAEAKDMSQPIRLLPPDRYAAELAAMSNSLRDLWAANPWLK